MKPGTQIEVGVSDKTGARVWESATIVRVERHMEPMPKGYHPVRFADGGEILVHENGFRVIGENQ